MHLEAVLALVGEDERRPAARVMPEHRNCGSAATRDVELATTCREVALNAVAVSTIPATRHARDAMMTCR